VAKYLPVCFGTCDEADPQCVGNPNGIPEEQIPCAYLKQCSAFTRYLERTGKSVAEYIKIKGEKAKPRHGFVAFEQFCKRLVKKELVLKQRKDKRKRDPNYDKRRDGPSSKAKRVSKVVKAKNAKDRKSKLIIRFDKFIKKLSSLLEDREFASTGQVVIPGQLYVFDRIDKSNYIGIRCKSITGRDIVIAVFKFKPWKMAFDIRFPFEEEELQELMPRNTFAKLRSKIQPFEEGKIKTVVKDAGKFERALLVEFIAMIVNKDVMDLPRAY
jgi:hypothetical protein